MNNSNLWNNQPVLRFSLSVNPELSDRVLRELHLFAREQNFRHVSPIIELDGAECEATVEGDPLEFLKLEARGIALANGRLLTFPPECFRAFVAQLPNKRLMAIGFARYPEVVRAGSGKDFITPWRGKEIWHGTVSTKDARFVDGPGDCRESHRVATDLLKQAATMNVVSLVEDMTGYWRTQNEDDLAVLECGQAQTVP